MSPTTFEHRLARESGSAAASGRLFLALCGGLACLLVAIAPAAAQDARWDRHKGGCDEDMRNWRTQSAQRLSDCMMTWEMYRDITKVTADQKAVAHEAFNKVYLESDERTAVYALSALKKLGLQPRQLREEKAAVPQERVETVSPVVRARPVNRGGAPVAAVAPPPADDFEEPQRAVDPRASKRAFDAGMGFYKQNQIPEALSEFLISADTDPTSANPLYMAARCYAMLNKPNVALEYLHRMKALNSEKARQLVRQAAKDRTFASMRAMASFKDLTGTAVIQLLNGAGDAGVAVVAGYKEQLAKSGMPVAAVGNDRSPRQSTYIYTKPGYERQGEDLRRLLKLGYVHKRNVDWPSQYDIVVVYGKADETKFIDDEAEKAGKSAAAEKKKKEDEAKRKKAEEEAKSKADMKKKLQMMKMMQEMESGDATDAVDNPADEVLPP